MNLNNEYSKLQLDSLRLDESISIIASIPKKPLIHVRAGFDRVIQIIQVIHHPRWALLVVSHEHAVEMGLWQLGLWICQDNFMHHRGFLLRNHLHRVLLHDNLLSGSSNR
jgi:hypothetical protein